MKSLTVTELGKEVLDYVKMSEPIILVANTNKSHFQLFSEPPLAFEENQKCSHESTVFHQKLSLLGIKEVNIFIEVIYYIPVS